MSISYRHQHVPRPPRDEVDYESIRQEIQLISSENFVLNQKLKGDVRRGMEITKSVRRAFLSSEPRSPVMFADSVIKRKRFAADEERQRENDTELVSTLLALPKFGAFKEQATSLSNEKIEKKEIRPRRKHGTALSSKKGVDHSSVRQPTQAFTVSILRILIFVKLC